MEDMQTSLAMDAECLVSVNLHQPTASSQLLVPSFATAWYAFVIGKNDKWSIFQYFMGPKYGDVFFLHNVPIMLYEMIYNCGSWFISAHQLATMGQLQKGITQDGIYVYTLTSEPHFPEL